MDTRQAYVSHGAFIADATPGAGIAAIVARVLGGGSKGAFDLHRRRGRRRIVWLSFAVAGLAVLAQTQLALHRGEVGRRALPPVTRLEDEARPGEAGRRRRAAPDRAAGDARSSPGSRSAWASPKVHGLLPGAPAEPRRASRRSGALGYVELAAVVAARLSVVFAALCRDGGAGAQPLRRSGRRARAQPGGSALGHGRGGGLGGRALAVHPSAGRRRWRAALPRSMAAACRRSIPSSWRSSSRNCSSAWKAWPSAAATSQQSA